MATKAAAIESIDVDFARSVVPKREAGAHKWGVGGVLIVGGAPGFVGAPALAAMGAMRCGAGVVAVAASRSVIQSVSVLAPEAIFVPLTDSDAQSGADANVKRIYDEAERCRAMVIGCGLGTDSQATRLMATLLATDAPSDRHVLGFGGVSQTSVGVQSVLTLDTPIVLDADALNWLAQQSDWSSRLPTKRFVLTPHPGEMARLLNIDVASVVDNPVAVATEAATTWQQTVALKGGVTVVTDGDRTLTATDVPQSLATAGSGDVFAGSVGAFLAQGLDGIDAAGLAAFAGCSAARAIEEEYGVLGLIASDLPVAYAVALKSLEGQGGQVG